MSGLILAIGAALLSGDAPPVVAAPPKSELDLVDAARRGEASAWTELYQRYARTVHACVLARVPPDEADDLVQDTFAAAHRRIDSLADSARFAGWLMTIARNRAVDYWRRARPSDPLPDDLEARPRRTAEVLDLLAAIRSLPESYAEILIMKHVEGMTGVEIAEACSMTPGSVRVKLSRGVAMLRDKLETSDD